MLLHNLKHCSLVGAPQISDGLNKNLLNPPSLALSSFFLCDFSLNFPGLLDLIISVMREKRSLLEVRIDPS